ncbi:glycosyltransferase family 4 protein [Colwellia sp. MB02u-18]|uniref:glycosyltransferase family 4 protein n=1 Tax=unclassified Colwellia TaxID=196834 RepID=UPI0015F76EAA|nr:MULTISPECIES: glycosyltransferase family 4 protein [unclassified Colwellia]MBA6222890.1 glycosyltransferase family 4 protein [Colwellia sp. MB3u-45]MBA6267829.1 glycosyltransferase family 4 protein [Colwellia sp. MB3u-43]MBA6322364.1 glycosyltransferase family 4 protein [Colwellia sp. MB02u-19]MBA6324363.1 glycosyltransferase family 4 protein [Colwellia sp. MB02u-18]MBA6332519.1 glycosyltransferase family 4 protein [Colwellia sp. MB02u-12]
MKLLFVITRSDVIGGASVHLHDLVMGMELKGHTVRVLIGGDGILLDRLLTSGVDVRSLIYLKRKINFLDDVKCYYELKKEVLLFAPDLIHLHSSKAGIIGRLVSHQLNSPSIFTAHGWSFTEGVSSLRRITYKLIERFIANYSDKIITVSEFDRKLALSNSICKSSLISTVRNGVKDRKSIIEKKAGDKVRLIMVARFDQQKNQLMLIEVLNKIKELPFEMVFVGDGPLLSKVKEKSARMGLNEKITFLGARNDVDYLLSKADVFILISNWEGLPLTILEGMSHGLPIIASNVGGVSETIDDDKEGFLIPRNGSDELLVALANIIKNADMRERFGRAARDRYENEFQVQQMIDSTENIYLDVFKGSNEK